MIRYFSAFPNLQNKSGITFLENTIAILRYSSIVQSREFNNAKELQTPHKFDYFVITHIIAGEARWKIDMVDYQFERGSRYMVRIAPGQIISISDVSEDFDAYVMLMSNDFLESLMMHMGNDLSFRGALTEVVKIVENNETHNIEMMIRVMTNIINDKDNPYRRKVLEHVLMAIFYGSEHARATIIEEKKPRTSADVITFKFLQEVKANFRKERQLGFYSERLCITPRYLSRVVREVTGYSAAEWIERYVVLEARALLKSTNMTIQQISDELNFPSQTFFGKYFKRRVGMSPKEYRRIG